MKQEIIPVLKKLISFPTTDGNKQAFIELFEYVKSLTQKDFIRKNMNFKKSRYSSLPIQKILISILSSVHMSMSFHVVNTN